MPTVLVTAAAGPLVAAPQSADACERVAPSRPLVAGAQAGRFARYVYREEMFPTLVFRRAYDAIQTPHHGVRGDLEYLRILHLAASTLQAEADAGYPLRWSEMDEQVRERDAHLGGIALTRAQDVARKAVRISRFGDDDLASSLKSLCDEVVFSIDSLDDAFESPPTAST